MERYFSIENNRTSKFLAWLKEKNVVFTHKGYDYTAKSHTFLLKGVSEEVNAILEREIERRSSKTRKQQYSDRPLAITIPIE